MTKTILGIIGGSGIYDLPGLERVREERIESPWGEPSAALRIGEIAGLPVVFLSRHDRGHRLSPSDINYRANIDVLKRAGVTDLVSLSACGSFKEELPPGTFVLIDQFVDRTYKRESSFFGKGCVAHVSMAHPVSPRLRIHLTAAADAEGRRCQKTDPQGGITTLIPAGRTSSKSRRAPAGLPMRQARVLAPRLRTWRLPGPRGACPTRPSSGGRRAGS